MANFKSVGTIRYEDDKWVFVPDANYCVMQHHKKDYAIFLGEGDEKKAISEELPESGVALVIPKENDILTKKVRDVENLTWRELLCFWEAKYAAMSQSKVMVIVKDNGNGNAPSLIGISPPPK